MKKAMKKKMDFSYSVICATALFAAFADTNITANVTLDADADWRDRGTVTIEEGVAVGLNGHTLKVKGLVCNGYIMAGSIPEYVRLSYIESSGTQYIKTGFKTTDKTAIDFDFTTLSDNGNHAYFCGDWANWGHLFVANGSFRFFGSNTFSGNFSKNTHFRLVTFPGGNASGKTVVMYNGESGAEVASSDITLAHSGDGEMTLFATSAGQQSASYRLHHFTLTHEGTIVRDLVPVKRLSDGTVGLYDLVNSKFYDNDGSGKFGEGFEEVTASGGVLSIDVSDGAAYSVAGYVGALVDVTDAVLAGDCDLRCFKKNLRVVGTVDLNGHTLKVNGLACDGNVTDSTVPEYRQLPYIQSSGTQYIKTGFTTTDKTAIDFDFTVLTDNGNKAYFCGDWANWGHLLVINGNNINFFGGTGTTIGTYQQNKHLRFQTMPGGLTTFVLRDGDTLGLLGSSSVALTHSGNGEMTLFAMSDGRQSASYRLHRFTLTHEGTLVRDFVPAQRTSDGTVGLYDLVHSKFYGNDGSGAFGTDEDEPVVCGVLVPSGRLALDVSGGAAYSVSGTCKVPVIVEDSILADDCDLRCFGRNLCVTGNVSLAGRTSTLAGMSGNGVVSDSSMPVGGDVCLDVPAGTAVVNSELALTGSLRLVKSGAGVFVAAKAGQAYSGGTVAEGGYVKPGLNSAGVFGAAGSTLSISNEAQCLDDIYAPVAFADHHLVLAGEGPDACGALRTVVSGKNSNAAYGWMRSLTLTGDALIRRDAYAFSLMATNNASLPLALNGHTLTMKSATEGNSSTQNHAFLLADNLSDSGVGTLVVGDNIQFFPFFKASVLGRTTVIVETNATYFSNSRAQAVTVSNLVYRSASTQSYTQTTTVLGCYTPASTTSAPKVRLGDASHLSPTLDLSSCSGTFDADFGGGLSFAEGATVSVKMGDRKVPSKVIGWAEGTGPANVRFVLADTEGKLLVKSDGVYRSQGLLIIVK